jgi:thermitase
MVVGLYVALLVMLSLIAYAPGRSRAQDNPPVRPQAVPNEYLISYAPGTTDAQIAALVAASGGTIVTRIPEINLVVVRLTTEAGVSRMNASTRVVALEPNALRYPTITPNDPQRTQQYGLGLIGLFTAWDVARGTGQKIAVLDTGVDLNHPDLAGHLLAGYDYADGDPDPSPDPDPDYNYAHGTHVAGIANALTNNGVGMAGVAWDAQTIPVRVIDDDGYASVSNESLGILFAISQGATVINMSLGGNGWIKAERDAINYAAAHGVIVVASAGNDNNSIPFYPASYDHVISVASVTSSSARSSFSNFNPWVDIAAPGSDIYSTLYDDTYGNMSGTSMAAPHISGVIALIQSAGRADTPAEVTEALLCTAKNLGAAGRDDYYGWGLVQANKAVVYTPGTANCLTSAPNDQIENALPVTFLYNHTVDTTVATSWATDPALPSPCADDVNQSVWYRFDATRAGTLTLNTAGSSYDTVLAAYKKPAATLNPAGCNDNVAAGDETSALEVDLTVGDVLYVMVSSKEVVTYHHELGFVYTTPIGGSLRFHAVFDYIPIADCYPSAYGADSVVCVSE